jgi:hypothetical protein
LRCGRLALPHQETRRRALPRRDCKPTPTRRASFDVAQMQQRQCSPRGRRFRPLWSAGACSRFYQPLERRQAAALQRAHRRPPRDGAGRRSPIPRHRVHTSRPPRAFNKKSHGRRSRALGMWRQAWKLGAGLQMRSARVSRPRRRARPSGLLPSSRASARSNL